MSNVLELPLVDARIASAVKALVSGQGRDVTDVAGEIGISRNAMYMKLRCATPFKASEVAALAELLGVTIGELYNGLDGRVGPRPEPPDPDHVVVPARRVLPHLDSNQEPAGNRPGLAPELVPAAILPFVRRPVGPVAPVRSREKIPA